MNSFIGEKKYDLDTPCLVIDKRKLLSNIELMQEHCKQYNVQLRPHVKTHKCSKIAQMQIEAGAVGICAAKISEAEVLARANIPGVLITSPVITEYKIKKLIQILKIRSDLSVVVDNYQNLIDLNNAAKLNNLIINVLIDLDPGIGRTGIKLDEVLFFAAKLKEFKNLNLVGVQCYAGNLQHITSYAERERSSLAVMHRAGLVAKELRTHGFCCDVVTGSGTGTYNIDVKEKEVTEIQPGSYIVMDVEYNAIDMQVKGQGFNEFSNSLTILTTVISSNNQHHVTVDAGWKALYVNDLRPKIISHANLSYDWGGFGDEHGKITTNTPNCLPKNGEVLEMVVPHCDPTINLFDRFYIIENDIVVDEWPIDMRGKSQ